MSEYKYFLSFYVIEIRMRINDQGVIRIPVEIGTFLIPLHTRDRKGRI